MQTCLLERLAITQLTGLPAVLVQLDPVRIFPRVQLVERRPARRYANGPTGCTTKLATHTALGPRTCELSLRARSTRHTAVRQTSTAPPTILNRCWVGESSDHFFLLLTKAPIKKVAIQGSYSRREGVKRISDPGV